MKLRSFFVVGISAALAHTAAAQPAPGLPAPPGSAPPPAALPPAAPAASPAAPPAAPPAASPPPYTAPNPAQPPGAGAYPPGAYPYPPPGGYPQPGWGPQPGPDGQIQATRLALELPYDPDKGTLPGYKVFERRRTPLMIAGGITLGSLWVVSAIAGGFISDSGGYCDYYTGQCTGRNDGMPMWIPVLGPFITIGSAHTDSGATTMLIFDGVAQAAGLGMFIAGIAGRQQVLKYQFQQAQVTLSPMAAPTQNGAFAGITGSF